MSGLELVSHVAGQRQINSWFTADATKQFPTGVVVAGDDPYWGGREMMYAKAGGTIAQFATVTLTPTLTSGKFELVAAEVGDTANLARPVGVALVGATVGQFIWVCIGGLVPVKSGASVAAATSLGITAAGTLGAVAAGKQILGLINILAATTTVAKANSVANSGSTLLKVTNSAGWFIGAYLSGTGIQAGTTITAISPNGTEVTLSLATSAVVAGTVTATYNNATVFYNVAHLNRPHAQGAIT